MNEREGKERKGGRGGGRKEGRWHKEGWVNVGSQSARSLCNFFFAVEIAMKISSRVTAGGSYIT